MKSKINGVQSVCATLLAGTITFTAIAWGADLPPISTTASAAPVAAPAAEPVGDPTLQGMVSFEAKRQPLSELLLDLQKQSGVQLSVAPGSRAAAGQVTARVKDLSLQLVMNFLARLYGGTWTKRADNAYAMGDANLNDVEVKLLQLGNVDELKARVSYAKWKLRDQRPSWPSLILPQVDGVALRSPQGVPLSDVDEQTRRALQEDYIQPSALTMLEYYSQAVVSVLDQGTLSIRTPRRLGDVPSARFVTASVILPHKPAVQLFPFGQSLMPDPEDLPPAQRAAMEKATQERAAREKAAQDGDAQSKE